MAMTEFWGRPSSVSFTFTANCDGLELAKASPAQPSPTAAMHHRPSQEKSEPGRFTMMT